MKFTLPCAWRTATTAFKFIIWFMYPRMGTIKAQLVVWLVCGLQYGVTGIRVPKDKIRLYPLWNVQTYLLSLLPTGYQEFLDEDSAIGAWSRIQADGVQLIYASLICLHVTAQEYLSLWTLSQRWKAAYSYCQEEKKKVLQCTNMLPKIFTRISIGS